MIRLIREVSDSGVDKPTRSVKFCGQSVTVKRVNSCDLKSDIGLTVGCSENPTLSEKRSVYDFKPSNKSIPRNFLADFMNPPAVGIMARYGSSSGSTRGGANVSIRIRFDNTYDMKRSAWRTGWRRVCRLLTTIWHRINGEVMNGLMELRCLAGIR